MDLIIKTVDVPLYRGKFSVCIGDGEYDLPDIYKRANEGDGFHINFAHAFLCNIQESDKGLLYCCFLIALNTNHTHRKLSYGDIAHEASHIAKFICDNRGIVADYNNDEPEAYLIGWITDEVMKLLIQNNIHVTA